jgi:pSer/pThr/pTyr-binding forkhead associated (FHA) protein
MYGDQPADVGVAAGAAAQAQPQPPDPYAQPPAAGYSRATLQGAAGVFTVLPDVEIRAGRDGSQCGILLTEPRVSGVHASLKLEGGQLMVRDDNSNNGTLVNGNRLSPEVWTPAPNGSLIRFGPTEFNVRLE